MVLLCKGTNKQAKSQNYSCLFRRKLPGWKNMAQGIGSRSTEHRPTLHVASAYAPRCIGLRSTLCKPLPQQGRKKGALVKANAPVGGWVPGKPRAARKSEFSKCSEYSEYSDYSEFSECSEHSDYSDTSACFACFGCFFFASSSGVLGDSFQ